MSEQYCAEIDTTGLIRSVIVCNDIDWARSRLSGEWIFCDTFLPRIGDSKTNLIEALTSLRIEIV